TTSRAAARSRSSGPRRPVRSCRPIGSTSRSRSTATIARSSSPAAAAARPTSPASSAPRSARRADRDRHLDRLVRRRARRSAQPWRGAGLLVRRILGAAGGEVGTGLWRAADPVEQVEEVRLASPDELLAPPSEPTVFVGELEPAWRDRIASLGPTALLASPAQS